MELDALDRELAVADAHHLSVRSPGGDFELVGNLGRRERVVAAGLEPLGQAREDALAVVLDRGGLPVEERLRGPDLAPEGLDDCLMAEADAERRHARTEPPDQLDRDARVRGPAGAGRDQEVGGGERLDLLDRDRVVPEDAYLRAQLLEEVDEVVGERVVVVDD